MRAVHRTEKDRKIASNYHKRGNWLTNQKVPQSLKHGGTCRVDLGQPIP